MTPIQSPVLTSLMYGPWLPVRRRHCRWQPDIPQQLMVMRPGGSENLWPVLEVVVHFQDRAPLRSALALHDTYHTLCARVQGQLALGPNCAFRLPTYCPAEPGAPLHLFLHQYQIIDPWNDEPPDRELSWGLVDVRRVA